MGWTSVRYNKREKSIDILWYQMGLGFKRDVLAHSMVGSTFYAAVNRNGLVFAMVVITRRDRDGWFSYKEMTEFEGPNEAKCPKKILNLLSPITREGDSGRWAQEWRERCYANLAAKSKARTWQNGDHIKVTRPLTFTSGETAQYFKLVKVGKRRRWWASNEKGDQRFPVRLQPTRYGYTLLT